jgi:OmpA-OmpF porin, OOP family
LKREAKLPHRFAAGSERLGLVTAEIVRSPLEVMNRIFELVNRSGEARMCCLLLSRGLGAGGGRKERHSETKGEDQRDERLLHGWLPLADCESAGVGAGASQPTTLGGPWSCEKCGQGKQADNFVTPQRVRVLRAALWKRREPVPRGRSAAGFAMGLCVATSALADADYDNCKDVFVARLAGFHIQECTEKTFDGYTFAADTPKATRVEGRIVDTYYRSDEGKEQPPLAVRRNYENVLKQAGWTVVYADSDTLTEMQVKNGEEHWIQLLSNAGDFYELVAGRKGQLEQSVTTADGMVSALNQDGRVALQINFDSGKATIRPDSQPIVAQILALLQNNPGLSVSVEGHTDNVGVPGANKRLSEARAKAVVASLVAKGISASRLTAIGFGQDRPVADNATEEGRAKNRRVELVKG